MRNRLQQLAAAALIVAAVAVAGAGVASAKGSKDRPPNRHEINSTTVGGGGVKFG